MLRHFNDLPGEWLRLWISGGKITAVASLSRRRTLAADAMVS
jgi:hypothetical protein